MNPFGRNKIPTPQGEEKAYLEIKCDLCDGRLDKQAAVKACDLVTYPHTHLYHMCKNNTTSVTIMGQKTVTSTRAYRFFCPKIGASGKYWGGDASSYLVPDIKRLGVP